MAGSNGNSCTHPSAVHLNTGALSLLSAANSNRTKSSYLRSWHLLDEFLGISTIQLPLSIPVVANFITFLHSNKYSPASVASHISAISQLCAQIASVGGIGAATEAAQLGYSESVIQTLGRWNSGAFRSYIRINAFRM